MNKIRPELLTRCVVPALLLVAACTDSPAPTGPGSEMDLPIAASLVVNFEAGDGAQFLFLPPLSDGKPTEPLATGLELTVTVCGDGESPSCVELEAVEEDDHYRANWKSGKGSASDAFSIVVSGFGKPLGELTLTLENRGSEKSGRTFPIKFWVGEGIAAEVFCGEEVRCNAAVVPDEGTTTIATEDETGNTIAEVTFPPEAVPEGGLVVTVDCRVGGFDPGDPGDGPLPTDLDQWPMFCHIDVLNPDGTEFVGDLPGDATLEVCVVDEFIDPDFHPFFNIANLLLGKSTDGTDFEFLPLGPSTLKCVDISTTAAGPATRALRSIGSRLASLFSPVLPQKLYASMSMFRDGGVGGLIRSFSDVNPVEPASIAGTVTDGLGDPIIGVTVTLTGLTSATATTDGSGDYSFEPLQAEVGGTVYTVTVSGLPFLVDVTGSGLFVADFMTTPDVFFNAVTGNYYQAFATRLSWDDARDAADDALSFRGCGGHLATITSVAENLFIVTSMDQVAVAGVPSTENLGGYWIGGFQPAGSSTPASGWGWVTSEPFSFTNWATGEPNDSGGAPGENGSENSMQFLGDWGGVPDKTRWNDEPGDRSYGYVVEYQCTPLAP